MSGKVCLLCFSFAKVIKDVKYTHLQSVVEVLADVKIPADLYPLCYICYAKLLRCVQLIKSLQQHNRENQPEVRVLVKLDTYNTDDWSLPYNSEKTEPHIKEEYIKNECVAKDSGICEIDIDIKEERSDMDSEYESGAPVLSANKTLHTDIMHKKCVTRLQIIGDIAIEYDKMESDEIPTIDSTQIIGVRLNKAAKSSAERGREFRARRALLKQSKKQKEPEDNEVASEIRAMEKRAKSAEATRRWREKKRALMNHQRKQAKTAAQRMREYRQKKKVNIDLFIKLMHLYSLNGRNIFICILLLGAKKVLLMPLK